jgi:NADH-quinone oxidoreductase subunit M
LKMGTYGFVRFSLPMFPESMRHFMWFLVLLSIIGIVYGALVALKQDDVKKLVAYSSVSHLGFTMLGIFMLNPNGITGGMLQMINHGLSTGALFLLVGVIYERRHTRQIKEFGGLAAVMPAYAIVFLIITLSSIGLPTLNGFVGEFIILAGAYERGFIYAAGAGLGIVLGAAYMLWLYQRMMFGKITNPVNEKLMDLTRREMVCFVPIIALCFWIGIYPQPFIEPMLPSINKIVEAVSPEHAHAKRIDEVIQGAKTYAAAHKPGHAADPSHDAKTGHETEPAHDNKH